MAISALLIAAWLAFLLVDFVMFLKAAGLPRHLRPSWFMLPFGGIETYRRWVRYSANTEKGI